MGNVSLKVLEKFLNFLFKKGYEPCGCYCKFCGYKHPFTQPSRCPALGKKCNKCKKERHFVQVCKELGAEGSQLAALEQRPPKNHNVHAYLGSERNLRA